MDTVTSTHPRFDQSSHAPRLRLAFWPVVWRLAVLLLIVREYRMWRWIRRGPRIRRAARIALMLLRTPRLAFFAFLFATIMAVLADLFVRLAIQPLVWYWYHPPIEASAGSFHLAPTEVVEFVSPARRGLGTHWQPGTLVLTNHRLWFFPRSWDAEPWSARRDDLPQPSSEPAPGWFWGLLLGSPDRLRFSDPTGKSVTFAVPDPSAVLGWLVSSKTAAITEPT